MAGLIARVVQTADKPANATFVLLIIAVLLRVPARGKTQPKYNWTKSSACSESATMNALGAHPAGAVKHLLVVNLNCKKPFNGSAQMINAS